MSYDPDTVVEAVPFEPEPPAATARVVLPPTAAEEAGEDPLVGWLIDTRYRVAALIAIGGMGCVYEALDLHTDERVALKTIRPDLAVRPRVVQRFVREMQTLTAAESPHVVRVLGHGRLPDGRGYYVMDLIDGVGLDVILEQNAGRPMEPRAIIRIGLQLARAVEHAHSFDIVHRDLKPENILVLGEGDGASIKVLDFGLAKHIGGSLDISHGAEVLGTPGYMAPEQIQGNVADVRTDLYACGVILYEMLTGQPPFEGDSPLDIMLAHVEQTPRLPSQLGADPKPPPLLEWLTMCCLYKEVERRFQTARELRVELENAARLFGLSVE